MLKDLNRTMFFKASFDIEMESGEDALWVLVLEIRSWLQKKSKWSNYTLPWKDQDWTNIKRGDQLKSSANDVSLVSRLHTEGDVYTWACEIIEDKKVENGIAPRQWVTEIGFRGNKLEKGKVSIVLSYGDRPGFIGVLQDEPGMSIPGIVNQLIDNPRITCSVAGISISRNATSISDATSAFETIGNPNRELPIILVTPTSEGSFLVEPQEIADALGPNSLVIYTNKQAVMNELNSLLECHGMQCYGGAIRVYSSLPRLDRPTEYTRHRFISARDIRDKGSLIVITMLRRALAQDVHFWETMLRLEDVKQLKRQSSFTKRNEAKNEQFQNEVLDSFSEIDEERIAAEQQNTKLNEDNKQLREENHLLEARCQSLTQALDNQKAGAGNSAQALFEYMKEMNQFPKKAVEVAKLADLTFGDCLAFTSRGWQSLDECKTVPEDLWQAFYDMATVLYPLFANDARVDIVKEFGNRSVFSYAKSEGMQTRKDKNLLKQRKDTYKGREIDIETHISSSNSDPTSPHFLRIYFAWDEYTGKILIGSCGKHLDNYTTRSRH